MNTEPSLLVVDDEPIVCESCVRVLKPQGYQVEVINDSRQGLEMAVNNTYDAILLDLKMPYLDGIQFLERLRDQNKDIPVLMITGYASIPSASAAMRLGACDYIAKPFTPDEISVAVSRTLATRTKIDEIAQVVQVAPAPPVEKAPATEDAATDTDTVRFYQESWVRCETPAMLRIGGFISHEAGLTTTQVRLPRVGEMVYRGLPMAALFRFKNPAIYIPAPATGRVVEVNYAVADDPSALWNDPCGAGWIARIRTQADDYTENAVREVTVIGAEDADLSATAEALINFGCNVSRSHDVPSREQLMASSDSPVVWIDAVSLGALGPDIVERLNLNVPEAKIVVLADPASTLEKSYRARRLFYYAVEELGEFELNEILASAFRAPLPEHPKSSQSSLLPRWIDRIDVTNRDGDKASCLIDGQLLDSQDGLGCRLVKMLLEKNYPVETLHGEGELTGQMIHNALYDNARVFILKCADSGRLPGSLTARQNDELVETLKAPNCKLVDLTMQPALNENLVQFTPDVIEAMAANLARMLTEKQSN
ncbi:response regulator [Candidatus Sumerlaeota bacterium]|nr:response regulator [Candidatus Sumerlaeota bacterium]